MDSDHRPAHRIDFKSFPERVGADDGPVLPKRTVFCAPAAGTGARSFLSSFARSPLRNNLRVAQFPGREDQLREPCMYDIFEMAEIIADVIVAEDVGDYALFGHSFGALVMLETARRLEQIHAPSPALLAVAACAAPHLPLLLNADEMEPTEVAEALSELGDRLDFSGPGGEELKALVLPALSADLRACNRYLDAPGEGAIASPILAMSGALDPAVTTEKMASWREYTTSRFEAREYAGGHFFPVESELPLTSVIEWQPEPGR